MQGLIRMKSWGFVLRAESTHEGFRHGSGEPDACVRSSDSRVGAGFVGSEAGSGGPAWRLTVYRWDMSRPG